jgi:hypothetical protein
MLRQIEQPVMLLDLFQLVPRGIHFLEDQGVLSSRLMTPE